MIDFYVQRINAHKKNPDRYSRLLATQLTESERQYIHRRIAEEHSALMKLEAEHLSRSVRSTADPRARSRRTEILILVEGSAEARRGPAADGTLG